MVLVDQGRQLRGRGLGVLLLWQHEQHGGSPHEGSTSHENADAGVPERECVVGSVPELAALRHSHRPLTARVSPRGGRIGGELLFEVRLVCGARGRGDEQRHAGDDSGAAEGQAGCSEGRDRAVVALIMVSRGRLLGLGGERQLDGLRRPDCYLDSRRQPRCLIWPISFLSS